MEKKYYLDLQTLLEYLQGQPALLSTEVNVPGLRGVCRGYLFLKDGAIIACMIQAPNGALVREGEVAYRLIQGNGEWQVRIDPEIERTFWSMKQQGGEAHQEIAPSPAAIASAPRPRRPLDPALLNQCSSKQRMILRMVFMLVNGQRTVEQIKAQLHLPAEVVEEALMSLRSMGVID